MLSCQVLEPKFEVRKLEEIEIKFFASGSDLIGPVNCGVHY